jgi:hypothetical protein
MRNLLRGKRGLPEGSQEDYSTLPLPPSVAMGRMRNINYLDF